MTSTLYILAHAVLSAVGAFVIGVGLIAITGLQIVGLIGGALVVVLTSWHFNKQIEKERNQ